MTGSDLPPPLPSNPAAGVGALGCASWFVLFGVLSPLSRRLATGTWEGAETGFVLAFLGLPALLLGTILAILGVSSASAVGRRCAWVAVFLLWGPVLMMIGCVGVVSLLGRR